MIFLNILDSEELDEDVILLVVLGWDIGKIIFSVFRGIFRE